MKIKVLTISVCAVLLLTSCQSVKEYDNRAVESLDAMSDTIGELSSCSYTLDTINSMDSGVEILNRHDVYMRGPDKMYVHTVGTNGEQSYSYNGSRLAYFSYTKDTYAMVAAPENIIKAIDFLHNNYGIDFPAADFFYPDFTDDILNDYDSVYFLEEEIDGVNTVSVVAFNDEETLQIWVDKATNLPYRMVIESKLNKGKVYDAVFSNWKIDPALPNVLFDFEPPANSERIQLKAKH